VLVGEHVVEASLVARDARVDLVGRQPEVTCLARRYVLIRYP